MGLEFPRYVFKGKTPDTELVEDEKEYRAALTNGWKATRGEAIAGDVAADVESAPSRAELEIKAAELGITYHPQIGDANLLKKIENALKAQE